MLTVKGGTVPGPSGEQLATHLQRNGIRSETMTVTPDGRSTGEAILAHAKSLGCDLIVKGAYTQSRLRQLIFGGATRHLLANSTLPILMAHLTGGKAAAPRSLPGFRAMLSRKKTICA